METHASEYIYIKRRVKKKKTPTVFFFFFFFGTKRGRHFDSFRFSLAKKEQKKHRAFSYYKKKGPKRRITREISDDAITRRSVSFFFRVGGPKEDDSIEDK